MLQINPSVLGSGWGRVHAIVILIAMAGAIVNYDHHGVNGAITQPLSLNLCEFYWSKTIDN